MNKENFKIDDFVAIYTDLDSECFGVGTVLAIDEKNIIISSVDPYGAEDGLTLYNIETIIKIEKESQYCTKIKNLMKKKQTELERHKFTKGDILQQLLELSKKKEKIVDIKLLNCDKSASVGYVSFLSDDICEIKQIDDYGNEDGACIFSIEDITSIKYNSIENRDIQLLLN